VITRRQVEDVVRAGLDLLYPRDCLICGEPACERPWRYLCAGCVEKMPWAVEPRCNVCGYPYQGEIEGERTCPSCIHLDAHFTAGRTLGRLEGGFRRIVIELKYHNGIHLLPDIGRLAAHADGFADFLQGGVLVPVPLHASRKRMRGFNQAEKIAHVFAKAAGGVPVKNLLRRTRPTDTQTRKKRAERMTNVKNAFALRRNVTFIKEQRYILVDDVFTTGATMAACAKVLHDAGAECIEVATVAHG